MILHPQLQRDCLALAQLELNMLLLMRDANYPWFILVPQRENISEIFQLTPADQGLLLQESSYLAQCLTKAFSAHKINIAALGNVVPQLHIHHIVRYHDDPAWPAPVWDKQPAKPYDAEQIDTVIARLKTEFTVGVSYLL